MSLAARVGRAIFWSQAGRLAEAAILFLFSLLLARVLGPSSYGLYALGMSLAGMLGFVTLLGLGPETLGRFLPELGVDGRSGRAARLLRSLLKIRVSAIIVTACALVAFRHSILTPFHFAPVLGWVAAILLVFAARSILDLLTHFSSGLLELRRVAVAKFVAAIIPMTLFLGIWLSGRASAAAAWVAIAVGLLAGVLILGMPLLARGSEGRDEEPLPLRRILAFGMFAWATNFFIYVLGDSMDVLLLGWLTPDRAAIGRYAIGARVVLSIVALLLGWASLVNVVSLSEAYQRKGLEGLATVAEAQWKFVLLSVIPPLLFLLRYARPVIVMVFGAAYAGSVPVTQILCGLLLCAAVFGMSIHGGVLYALNRERVACGVVGLAAVFNVVSEILLVRRMGVVGGAWATGASFILLAVLCLATSSRYAPLGVPAGFFLKIAASAGAGLLATAWLHPASAPVLAKTAVLYAGVFLACLALLKPLSSSDSASLRRVNRVLGGCAERFFTTAYASATPAAGDR